MLVLGLKTSLYDNAHTVYQTMYILGLRSSCGTLRVCPSWSPSGHILTPALSPFLGARVRSHAVRRRLFIVLMTAAHISPNVFSLQMFLTNVQWTTDYNTHGSTHTYLYITFIHTFTSLHYIMQHIHAHSTSSFLLLFVAGWLLSTRCVRYTLVFLIIEYT